MYLRIIPARAGFTWRGRARATVVWDHPRSRGVYARGVISLGNAVGSSPLARGLPYRSPVTTRATGIIPARAGFTRLELFTVNKVGDHPRSRGVYPRFGRRVPATDGSSPLARGLHEGWRGGQWWPRQRRCRIIPARAGFTQGCLLPTYIHADHPRSRGVYSSSDSSPSSAAGSSPLARGLHKLIEDFKKRLGIIPARAGFTDVWTTYYQRIRDHPRSRGVYGE